MKRPVIMFLLFAALVPAGMRLAFADDAAVASRLKAIENKQDKILQQLELLKSEVQNVKIRVSSQ